MIELQADYDKYFTNMFYKRPQRLLNFKITVNNNERYMAVDSMELLVDNIFYQ